MYKFPKFDASITKQTIPQVFSSLTPRLIQICEKVRMIYIICTKN